LKIVFTHSALNNLTDICDYYFLFVSVQTSKNIEDGIMNSILTLEDNPFIGMVSIELQTKVDKRIIRSIVNVNYRIYYEVQSDIIYILKIMDCRQEPIV
jgi:plasmid stabilization system protein ParE